MYDPQNLVIIGGKYQCTFYGTIWLSWELQVRH